MQDTTVDALLAVVGQSGCFVEDLHHNLYCVSFSVLSMVAVTEMVTLFTYFNVTPHISMQC